jgi:hypothetical protein
VHCRAQRQAKKAKVAAGRSAGVRQVVGA